MRIATLILIWFALTLVAGCGSNSTRPGEISDRSPYPVIPASGSATVGGDFAGSPGVDAFVRRMQQQHGFTPYQTAAILSGARREQSIIDLMDRQAPRASTGPNGAWTRYRAKFLTDDNIANGVRFWQRNQSALNRASARYGVPPEYIVAIIGVETRYGGYVGKTRIIDALATLSFAYPRRAPYFTGELESFLVMTRDEGVDPFAPRGSFAGAMGLGQFMPTSFRDHAVDLDGDGHRDLWDPADAIGSVANYFKSHGWQTGKPVAVRAEEQSGSGVGLLKNGFDTRYSLHQLSERGITPVGSLSGISTVSLLKLDVGSDYDYWLGTPNFFTITRYNHSTYYAMAVHQLAQAIKSRKGGSSGARLSYQADAVPEAVL